MESNAPEIDDILKKYLPHSADEEMESARDRFLMLLRQRHELQECLDNFKSANMADMTHSKFVFLGYVDQLVLTAIYLLQGEGNSFAISNKVNILTSKVFDIGSVFVSLDRLERGLLISSRLTEGLPMGSKPNLSFTVTEAGKRMLGEVRTAAGQLMDALQDFA